MINRYLFFFIMYSLTIVGQEDKLFLSDNTVFKCRFISFENNYVYYKLNDTSFVNKISRDKVVKIQTEKKSILLASYKNKDSITAQNFFTRRMYLNPFSFFSGNISIAYEQYFNGNNCSLFIPFTLLYDHTKQLQRDTLTFHPLNRNKIDFKLAIALNLYLGNKENRKFYIGPRLQYGSYLIWQDIQGWAIQAQTGWKIRSPLKRFNHNICVSYGFGKPINTDNFNVPKNRTYGVIGFDYYIGFGW